MRKLLTTALVSVCLIGLGACSHQSGSVGSVLPASNPHGRTVIPKGVYGGIGPAVSSLLSVLLGDAPPNLGGNQMSALNIGVKEVDAIENGQTTVLAQFSTPYVVNVLNEPGNSGQNIATAQSARSDYQQVRLVVDLPSSTGVFANGASMPINFQTNDPTLSTVGAGSNTTTTPIDSHTVAIVLNQPFSIPSDGTNAVRLDFNAFESLTLAANGSLNAQPTLFVAPVDNCGSISGQIMDNGNPVQNAVVVAYAADGSIGNTGSTDSNGNFSIHTLNSGTYNLVVYNSYVNAAGMSFTSSSPSQQKSAPGPQASVSGGQDTNVGTIQD